ncbi:aminoglycoside adenylyltransferase domain-containing protein [Micromonospora sp. NPDC049559]|uniref:aminoglycoside adenylyltransferase domain-containing protein n=1 Tax=Micromonospora sp. NPDC049559 TaxID=3155923 RepID=UPI003419F925
MTIRLPAAEATYLDSLLHRLHGAFGDELVAVYPTGSLALDGYVPGRSDIDLICVTIRPPSEPVLRDLAARLDHRVLPCPAAGLEFVLYGEPVVRAGTVAAGYALNLNTGRELTPKVSTDPYDGPGFWYAIDRSVAYQCDVALFGPRPRELMRPAPFESLLPVVIESVEEHLKGLATHGDNAVLNGCRALCFATGRSWRAKPAAAEWARRATPEFAEVIGTAMAGHAAGRGPNPALAATDARAFLEYVLDRLHAAGRRGSA